MFQDMQHAWNQMFAEIDRTADTRGYSRNATNFGKFVGVTVFVVLAPFGFAADLVIKGVAQLRPE